MQKGQKSRPRSYSGLDFQEPQIDQFKGINLLELELLLVNEVASVAIHAASLVDIHSTLFGFVLGVNLTVFSQFMWTMSELASLFVGAEPALNELFAELTLLLVLLSAVMRRIMVRFGQHIFVVSGWFWGVGRSGWKTALVEAFSVEGERGIFLDELPACGGHGLSRQIIINKLISLIKSDFNFYLCCREFYHSNKSINLILFDLSSND